MKSVERENDGYTNCNGALGTVSKSLEIGLGEFRPYKQRALLKSTRILKSVLKS